MYLNYNVLDSRLYKMLGFSNTDTDWFKSHPADGSNFLCTSLFYFVHSSGNHIGVWKQSRAGLLFLMNCTHLRTSLLNCCLLPRNSPIICLLSPFLSRMNLATPTGVSDTKPLSIRYWIPFSGFLWQNKETGCYLFSDVCFCNTF